MRRISVLSVSLAVLVAFLIAPYRHVHLATGHEQSADHKHYHDDDIVVHAHFYAESAPASRNGATSVNDSDRNHVVRSLEVFTPMPQAGFYAFGLPEWLIFLSRPADLLASLVEATEPCGHDPPSLEFSPPRGPPA
jgi:hypothetical protein